MSTNQNTMVSTLPISGYAPVNGLSMYYEIHGEGQPLVLLHGSYGTIGSWENLLPTLAKNRKVIAVEMQGHGRTADSDRPFSHEAVADDVAQLLDQLNISSTDVLGYSFGGMIALQLGIKHPELVRKLVVLSSVFKYEGWLPEVRQALTYITPELFEHTPLKTDYIRLAPDPEHWSHFVKKFAAFFSQDFNLGEENVKGLKSPILFIMGDNDGVSATHKAELYRLCGGDVFGDMTGLPSSQFAVLPGTTHVSLLGQSDRMLPLITDFLDVTK